MLPLLQWEAIRGYWAGSDLRFDVYIKRPLRLFLQNTLWQQKDNLEGFQKCKQERRRALRKRICNML